jgi:hypothetical protein
VEIVFGSERILSKEHLALAQASQTIQAFGFADALVDQKALVETGRPSHEKLYPLSGLAGQRVVTGSALSTFRAGAAGAGVSWRTPVRTSYTSVGYSNAWPSSRGECPAAC